MAAGKCQQTANSQRIMRSQHMGLGWARAVPKKSNKQSPMNIWE